MKQLIGCLVIISCLLSDPVWPESNRSVILPNVNVIKGGHCESSAIMNALWYVGYNMSEAVVAGGGGAPAFSIMSLQGNFPFLGGRSHNMREVFFEGSGIKWHLKRPGKAAKPWADILEILDKGIPTVLRVDMRYLPYLYGGHYGPPYMSFGWHMITLFGIDLQKKVAYVSDTGLEGLQEIKLQDLEKARFSNTRVFPPGGEYYWIEKKPSNYQLDWRKLTLNAINQVIKNMETAHPPAHAGFNANMGLTGLKNLGNEIVNIENTLQNSFMIPIVFNFWYGCIETNGTGGAAFRILFRDFLKEAGEKAAGIDTTEAVEAANASIAAWHQLANSFKQTAEKIGGIPDKEIRKKHYQNLAKLAAQLHQKEEMLYNTLKSISSE
jgi:hypothetical protein